MFDEENDFFMPDESEDTTEDMGEETTDGDDDLLFSDEDDTEVVEEESEEPEVETEESEEVEDTTETQADESDIFELPFKYNHSEGTITDKAEATRLIQLGMYLEDKVKPELESLKAIQEPFGKIDKIAKLYGMDIDQLHDALYNQYIEQQADEQGLSAEQVRKDYELQEREAKLQKVEETKQVEKQRTEMYDRFLKAYPDGVDKITPETWAKVNDGMDLSAAYIEQMNADKDNKIKELEKQLTIQTQNKKNKSSSPVGSATSNGSAEPKKKDDFLEAFGS